MECRLMLILTVWFVAGRSRSAWPLLLIASNSPAIFFERPRNESCGKITWIRNSRKWVGEINSLRRRVSKEPIRARDIVLSDQFDPRKERKQKQLNWTDPHLHPQCLDNVAEAPHLSVPPSRSINHAITSTFSPFHVITSNYFPYHVHAPKVDF